jgi:hypothetical protein
MPISNINDAFQQALDRRCHEHFFPGRNSTTTAFF